MRRSSLLSLAVASIIIACQSDRPLTTGRISADISDGANAANCAVPTGTCVPSNPHFFFLPPMVKSPSFSGTFNQFLAPRVDICVVASDPNMCVAGSRFTLGTAALDVAGQQYRINWNTDPTISTSAMYRILVFTTGGELGFADVQPVSNGSQLKKVGTDEVIALVDGRTLPIKFRIEGGASCAGRVDCIEKTVGPGGDDVTTPDHLAAAHFPAGALSTTVTVTIFQVTDRSAPCLNTDYEQFDFCYDFKTDPGPQAFNTPVRVEVCPNISRQDPRMPFLQIFQSDPDQAAVPLPGARQELIDCPGFGDYPPPPIGARSSNRLFQFATREWWKVKAALRRLVMPRPAFAATAVIDDGLGGTTDGFSHIGWALPARIGAAGKTNLTALPGETLRLPVQLFGLHPVPRPVPGIPVVFAPAPGAGTASPATAASDAQGLAAADWTIPFASGTYTLMASAPATGGPIGFSVTTEGTPIDFEHYPSGLATCGDCAVTDAFASLGLTLSFASATESGLTNWQLVQSANNPAGAQNHDITAPELPPPGGGFDSGIGSLLFSGSPREVRFEARVNNSIPLIPLAVYDGAGGVIREPRIARTSTTYQTCPTCTTFRREIITIVNVGDVSGISRVDIDTRAGEGVPAFIVLVDNLIIVP